MTLFEKLLGGFRKENRRPQHLICDECQERCTSFAKMVLVKYRGIYHRFCGHACAEVFFFRGNE